jgi:rSAM/selenodomain-associated transferase 1
MAKAPRPGMVKTRLNQSLPAEAVIALYRALLQDTVRLATSLKGVDVAAMCRPSEEDELSELAGSQVEIVAQTGDGLAAGLTSVFRHFTEGGRREVIAFNSDSPHLAPSVLLTAFDVLANNDVVVGPTHDGGYYLVGAKTSYPTLFENDGLGTRSALDRLLSRTKALELSTGFTAPFYDIDVAEDLLQLEQELKAAPEKAPQTAAWLADWKTAVAQLRQRIGER